MKCNAPILSKGAILVDLPGNGDANAARNAVAFDYLQRCDSIWIVPEPVRYVPLCDTIPRTEKYPLQAFRLEALIW